MTENIPNNAELAMAPDNTHHLVYCPFHGLAGCIRATLVISGEPFQQTILSYADWAIAKPLTPFGHVPLLREETKSGKILELAEISTIEQFLAQRLGLLGKDLWEEYQIKMFLSSTHALVTFLTHTVVQSPKEDRPAFLERFKKNNLTQWIASHEKHLTANGSNGHHVGDQLSNPDIKTASFVDHLVRVGGEEVIISEVTPAIWKVKTTLEQNPKYAEWRDSEQFKSFTKVNLSFFGY
ncbi:hypothetical protein BGZ70_007758 [Mortierella alpina]|uniref:GST N-terminal domain-containing protein n=1 Tax=Mortierella alpina TaxID=64518 RepID=A0A9P6JEA7_MORAP|nr:hypothetical protein BGZ70_007758 [Mortierella alpina]